MTQSIPASQFTAITTGVLAAVTSQLQRSSLWLTTNANVAIGAIYNFPSAISVANFFGAASQEATLAAIYFLGFDNSNIKPSNLKFAQYNQSAVPAYLRSGAVSSLTIAQLQALTGILTVTVDGTALTSSTINLSSATSFSAAATLIQSGFATNGPLVTYNAQLGSFVLTSKTSGAGGNFTASTATSTLLTVTAVAAGTVLQVGQYVSGTGIPAGAYISALGTGTGGVGTYTLSAATTATATGVACNANASSITVATGTLSAGLNLTTATGAITSQGANAATESGFMNALVLTDQSFVTWMTLWEPTIDSATAFASWNNSQGDNFNYVNWDLDITATTVTNNASCLGGILKNNQNSGATLIYGTADKAAFYCGAVSSADYDELNGWVNYAYKSQSGLVPDVTDQTSYQNLISNGYNCYCQVSINNDIFNDYQPGSITGKWMWSDNYVDQIVLKNMVQASDMTLMNSLKSLSQNEIGRGILRASTLGPINYLINYGAIESGLDVSQAQAAILKQAAGLDIAPALVAQGYYLQILPSNSTNQALRKQARTLWYTGARGINTLQLSAINVQ